ncbi:MAG TPA: hypothetical protein VGK63_01165 [Candidatus Limnocylindrales bacterium]
MHLRSAENHDQRPDGLSLGDLIEELRRIERRRLEATPGSSEYIEVLGFERTTVDRIRERIDALDRGPYWSRSDPAEGRPGA